MRGSWGAGGGIVGFRPSRVDGIRGAEGEDGTNRNRQIDTGIPLRESNRWRGVRR